MTISVKYNREAQTITWSSDRTARVAVARLMEMSEGVRARAMFHGVDQRGTDAGAMGFDHWDGKDKPKRYALDDEKMQRIQRVVDHLNAPGTGWEWGLRPSSDPLAGKGEEELRALIASAQARLASIGIQSAAPEADSAGNTEG